MPRPINATRSILVLLAISGLTLHTATAGSAHRVDGDLDDWLGVAPAAIDPSGDSANAFDLTTLSLDNEGAVLYLQFDTSVVRNLQSGSGSDGNLVLSITLPSAQVLTIDMRNRNAWLGSPANTQSWGDLGWTTAPTFAADLFEAQIDLGAVGVNQGDTVSIAFSGSDSFDSGPVNYTMTGAGTVAIRRSPDKLPATAFRIASINTEFGGLIGGARQNSLRRMIDGVDAHVYCFMEEWDNNAPAIETLIESIDPLDDGADWTVYKNDGQVIAARGTIVPLNELDSRYAAAIVEPVAGLPIIVLAAHLKCCGFINSSEDAQRISQSQDMAQTIATVRNAPVGSALEPYKNAPVVVVGDYNLVGSESPVTILAAAPAPGLVRWILPHLIGESITTWRDDASSFWPGTLDVLMHSPDLVRRNGFVLDTGELDPGEAAALGVLQIDSLIATDHLMLVADFGSGLAGDINGDCVVDTADLGIVIGEFLTPGAGGADLNADGIVDTADLGLLIGAFGNACD
jgi:hypothetical protein